MNGCRALVVALLWFALPLQAVAVTPVVDAVQMPAWIERNGQRNPLAAGQSLQPNDRLFTGDNARLLVRMPEGSLVKLGENATLGLGEVGESRTSGQRLVTATLDVLKGAFRFTTQVAADYRGTRNISIRVATVTAGIRGTDLWGKSDDQRDLVCLIEGKIDVTRGLDAAVQLDQPLDFYVAPKDGSAPQKAKVEPRQLEQWARETEIDAGAGAARRGGAWQVQVVTVSNQQDALAVYDKLRNAGYAAQIVSRRAEAGIDYRIRISGLPSQSEAQALAQRLKPLGIEQARVSR